MCRRLDMALPQSRCIQVGNKPLKRCLTTCTARQLHIEAIMCLCILIKIWKIQKSSNTRPRNNRKCLFLVGIWNSTNILHYYLMVCDKVEHILHLQWRNYAFFLSQSKSETYGHTLTCTRMFESAFIHEH